MNQHAPPSSNDREERFTKKFADTNIHFRPKIVAELDLHGYTKEKATSRMTWFLDDVVKNARFKNEHKRSPIFVTIITGTGKHSQRGPVLRQAVMALLEKRQMTYKLNHGKGSFTVDAASGYQLFSDNQQRFDSKVVLTSETDELPMGYATQKGPSIRPLVDVVSGDGTSTTKREPNIDNLGASHMSENSPLPSEVFADDALFQHVKQISSSEAAKVQSLRDREKNELEKAKSLSLENEENNHKFCTQQLDEAIRISQREHEDTVRKENEMLKQALSLSIERCQFNGSHENEDAMIQKALALSTEQLCAQSCEEMEIKKAIELSLLQN